MSRGGVLLEVAARFPLHARVRLKIAQAGSELAIATGCVAWGKVASIVEGRIGYQVGIVFEQPIPESMAAATGIARAEDCNAPSPQATGGTPASETDAPDDVAVALAPLDEGSAAVPNGVDGNVEDMRKELAGAAADLMRQCAINQSLTARLKQSEELQAALRNECERERQTYEEERSILVQQADDAIARADAFQAQLAGKEEQSAQRSHEQEQKYQTLISELIKANNEQQSEYQQLMERMTADRDEQRRRVEEAEAEIGRIRAEARQQRAEAEVACTELEARLEAAEALCAAHQTRYERLRREVERLMTTAAELLIPDFCPADANDDAFEDHPKLRVVAS